MKCKNGQSTVEYAVVVAVIIAALLAMQVYVKRGAMGKLRASADQLGEQFEPKAHTSDYTRNYNSTKAENTFNNGRETSAITSESQTRSGSEVLTNNLTANMFQ